MARIVTVARPGDASVLRLEDRAVPAPGQGEARIRVAAFALNRGDVLYRSGAYFEQPGEPGRIGYDCAGVIDAVGADAGDWRVGDRVATFPAFSQNAHGVYGEVAIVPANALMPWPEALSAEEAASLGTQYMTAFFALFEIGRLQAGAPVLITAGGSGTGAAAIQLAKAAGATVIATTRDPGKVAALQRGGADHVVVTSESTLGEAVLAATGGLGVPLVADCVGGADFGRLPDAMRPGGTLVSYGFLGGSDLAYSALPFYRKGLSIRFIQVFQMTGLALRNLPQQTHAVAEAKALIAKGVETGVIRPTIGATFTLDDVAAAHRLMESNATIGKIVVVP